MAIQFPRIKWGMAILEYDGKYLAYGSRNIRNFQLESISYEDEYSCFKYPFSIKTSPTITEYSYKGRVGKFFMVQADTEFEAICRLVIFMKDEEKREAEEGLKRTETVKERMANIPTDLDNDYSFDDNYDDYSYDYYNYDDD